MLIKCMSTVILNFNFNLQIPVYNYRCNEIQRGQQIIKLTNCQTCDKLSLRVTRITVMLPCIVINFFLNNQPDALIIPIFFCYKTPHVSGIFSAHHQEFSTVRSAMVSFIMKFHKGVKLLIYTCVQCC